MSTAEQMRECERIIKVAEVIADEYEQEIRAYGAWFLEFRQRTGRHHPFVLMKGETHVLPAGSPEGPSLQDLPSIAADEALPSDTF